MNAPVCPISRNQLPAGGTRVWPTTLPAIPIATDLPSLIRAVNIMRDILRTITTSLTVNNVWEPQLGANIYILSDFPSWYQSEAELVEGFVYYKKKGEAPDDTQRAVVQRTNSVTFRNHEVGGEEFKWRLKKSFDSDFGDKNGVLPFAEDFFERIVNVKWSTGLAVEFGDKAEGPPKSEDDVSVLPPVEETAA